MESQEEKKQEKMTQKEMIKIKEEMEQFIANHPATQFMGDTIIYANQAVADEIRWVARL